VKKRLSVVCHSENQNEGVDHRCRSQRSTHASQHITVSDQWVISFMNSLTHTHTHTHTPVTCTIQVMSRLSREAKSDCSVEFQVMCSQVSDRFSTVLSRNIGFEMNEGEGGGGGGGADSLMRHGSNIF